MPDTAGHWKPASAPPETLGSGHVTLRRWRAGDAALMHDLITANLDHLRPWMPWVSHEPLQVPDRARLLGDWETAWNARADFTYVVILDGEPAGSTGLHTRQGAGVLEIGYWVAASLTGRGVATVAARLLAEAALALDGVSAVEIHHDAGNAASGRVAEKAGLVQVSTYAREPQAPGDTGVAVRWVRTRD